MIIVGLTGGIGHGKTTLSIDLARHAKTHKHYESSDIIIEVANDLRAQTLQSPLPTDLNAINDWLKKLPYILSARVNSRPDFAQIRLRDDDLSDYPAYFEKLLDYLVLMQQKPELQKQAIALHNKQTFRSLLQWLGGYLAKKVSGDIWFKEILRRIEAAPPQELNTIGGVRFPDDAHVIKNHGGSIVQIVRPAIGEADLQDLTERERSDISVDITIYNNGDLKELKEIASKLYGDLLLGKAKTKYYADEQA
jgi:hypothetical protein